MVVFEMQQSKIESGVQLFSRVNQKIFLEGINPVLFPEGGPHHNQVIEVTGDPQIDKSDLLIDFIVKCILPNKYNEQWKNSVAILINTDFQISVLKIIKVIETFLIKHNVTDSKQVIIENALKNLVIFNCYNIEKLELTFYYLEKIIQCNENVSLVVVDNIAAHFWTTVDCDMQSYYRHSTKMFELLHGITTNLQVLVIFVRNELTSNKRKFNNNVDFRIEIEKFNSNYKAVITNYETEKITFVTYQINTILEFS